LSSTAEAKAAEDAWPADKAKSLLLFTLATRESGAEGLHAAAANRKIGTVRLGMEILIPRSYMTIGGYP
jgi:hypothetical protein